MPLTSLDQQLIELAIQTIKKHLAWDKHRLATVIQTAEGTLITGINMEGSFGCNDVCAEQITLGKALSEGHRDFQTLVTVRYPKPEEADQSIRVVNPCGKCRELICDYAPQANIIVNENGHLFKVPALTLLPQKYK